MEQGSPIGCAGNARRVAGEKILRTLKERGMAEDDNLVDRMVLYTGVTLAVLGFAGAGFAVVRALILRWLASVGA